MGQSTWRTGIDKCSTWGRWDPHHRPWQGSVKSACGAGSEGTTEEIYAKPTSLGGLHLPFTLKGSIFVLFSFQAKITQRGAGQFCARYMEKHKMMQLRVMAKLVTQGVALPGPTKDTFDVPFRKLPGQG